MVENNDAYSHIQGYTTLDGYILSRTLGKGERSKVKVAQRIGGG